MLSQVLYSDPHVTVYKGLIQINKYYFPLATSRSIMITDINTMSLNDATGVDHRWGTRSGHLDDWFHLDPDRLFKKKYIEIRIKDQATRPCITPDFPDECFQILWENFTEDGHKFVEEVIKKLEEKAAEGGEDNQHTKMKKAMEEEQKKQPKKQEEEQKKLPKKQEEQKEKKPQDFEFIQKTQT